MANVVVVEDEALIMFTLLETIERLGHQVHGYNRGEKALDAIKAGIPVDVLITDVNMPGLNGADLAKEVRQLFPEMPIIYASGHTAESVDKVEDNFYFITKPYWEDDLANVFALALK